MNLIVCVDKNWAIGLNGDLLEKIPEDLRYFKELTVGKTVIMGRKTFESIGKPLNNRRNIVLTRGNFYYDGIETFNSVEAVLQATDKDAFVIGGAEIYRLFIKHCKKAYVTKIHKEYEADTFIDCLSDWKLVEEGELKYYNGIAYQFNIMEAINENNKLSV